MKLSSVSLQNCGIIRNLTVPCLSQDGSEGAVVVISGANATGKSTILNAVLTMFEGGSNPELIGPAGDEYRIELVFDNGWRFVRAEGRDKYDLKGYYPEGGKITSPATALKKLLADPNAFSPTGLVDANPKERAKFLQAAIPMEFYEREIREASGSAVAGLPIPRVMDAARFAALRDGMYDKRREANVRLDQLRSTRRTLAESLPDDDPLRFARRSYDATTGAEIKPDTPILDAVEDLKAQLESAKKRLATTLESWRKDAQVLRDEIAAAEQAEIDAIRQEAERKIEAVRVAKTAERDELQAKYEATVQEMRIPFDADVEDITKELAAAEQRAADERRLVGVRDSIAKLDSEIETVDSEAALRDEAVKGLDALKRRKLDSAPIPDVEVRDGRIYYRGLDFDTQLNTAQQYLLSFQVAALTRGDDDLRLMVFDQAEALDSDNRAAFIEGIKAAGFQVLMAEVVDGAPLVVRAA
jgi:energy-coupling factor transporter ATP-binding protein EcfA2